MARTAVWLVAAVAVFGVQEKRDALPKRGDTVLVHGCLEGSRIASDNVKVKDGEGSYSEAVTFRLTGDKKLLEQIKSEHDGHKDVLTAVLKSELPRDTHKQVGSTRIGIGLPQPAGAAQIKAVPALEVKAIEHTDSTCR